MRFTHQAYRDLLSLLREQRYAFQSYHTWLESPRCVILRHDIDSSLQNAVEMAEVEADVGVSSTYFVLLRTDFYNVASRNSQIALQRIMSLGHEIGLHFDEVAYGKTLTAEETKQNIIKECGILSELLDVPVTTVSMHRPSQAALESNLEIPGIVNSYGKTFFRDFKYLSDSHRNWREPVLDIVRSGEYDRLHILTHAFWYQPEEESLVATVGNFIRSGSLDRYHMMAENIRNIDEILKEDEL